MTLVDTRSTTCEPSAPYKDKAYQPQFPFTQQLKKLLEEVHLIKTMQGYVAVKNPSHFVNRRSLLIDSAVNGLAPNPEAITDADAFISEALTNETLRFMFDRINANNIESPLAWGSILSPAPFESQVKLYADDGINPSVYQKPGDVLLYARAQHQDIKHPALYPTLLVDCKLGKRKEVVGLNTDCLSFASECGYGDFPHMIDWLHGDIYDYIEIGGDISQISKIFRKELVPYVWSRLVYSTYAAMHNFNDMMSLYRLPDTNPYRTKLRALDRAMEIGYRACSLPIIEEPWMSRARDRLWQN
ncbi:MAG: hypothetical protein NUV52_00580 [Candidatus Roizmanbacteria bacterium]|nr:hypothetical protein [Candidatus Roizmanbacteria bacterium]